MKNTVQITIEVSNTSVMEELIAELSAINFDGFEEKESELLAFIDEQNFEEEVLSEILSRYKLSYAKEIIEERNWNAYWESNFEPVIVEDFCVIRADFHEAVADSKYEIIITPKMSFGTGHHATTYMMIREMGRIDFEGKVVADFGTGTGVLAILAEKLGSKKVVAIDYDDWSIENSKENIEKNNCINISLEKADEFKPQTKFNVILANINKNVILANADGLLFGLNSTGKLLLSGLLKDDEEDILSVFTNKGLTHIYTVERNNWICILLEKA